MRYLSIFTICLLTVWLAGCTSSKSGTGQQQSDSQKSTFKTKVTETNFGINSDGLANPAKVLYQYYTRYVLNVMD